MSAAGESPPSAPSDPVYVGWSGPARSAPPNSLNLQADGANVRIAWYPPGNALSPQVFARRRGGRSASTRRDSGTWTPVVWYLVTCSNGRRFIFGGHNRISSPIMVVRAWAWSEDCSREPDTGSPLPPSTPCWPKLLRLPDGGGALRLFGGFGRVSPCVCAWR